MKAGCGYDYLCESGVWIAPSLQLSIGPHTCDTPSVRTHAAFVVQSNSAPCLAWPRGVRGCRSSSEALSIGAPRGHVPKQHLVLCSSFSAVSTCTGRLGGCWGARGGRPRAGGAPRPGVTVLIGEHSSFAVRYRHRCRTAVQTLACVQTVYQALFVAPTCML